MASNDTAVASLDAIVTDFLSTWSTTTTILLVTLLTILIYPLLTAKDPDVHPYILARQSTPSPIRHPGKSAVYRALDVPHSYPLKSGLGVKDANSPKWSPGRKGDVRDILRQAARGPEDQAGGGFDASKAGKLLTVLGSEKVVEKGIAEVTEQVNAVGWWLKKQEGVGRCAVYLSNSVELLVLVFAAAFYDFSVVLIPPALAEEEVNSLLVQAKADVLVTEAGALNVDGALGASSSIKTVVLVAKGSSGHMNFDEPTSESRAGKQVVMWNTLTDLAKAQGESTRDALPVDNETSVKPLLTFVSNGSGYKLVEFTSDNLVAGISGLNATVGRGQNIGPTDTLLPTTSLTDPYTLTWVLTGIFTSASIALNSVAGEDVDLEATTASISPTILVSAPATIKNFLSNAIKSGLGPAGFRRFVQSNSLVAGNMPAKHAPAQFHPLSKVRLVLIGQPVWQKTRLTSEELDELRLRLGARIGYALTAPEVAGAVAQTNIQDYRNKGNVVSVGPPVGSVEIHMVGEEESVSSSTPQGKIVVRGPAVAGGNVELNGLARIAEDNTVSLV
ncbi:hypothetical protein DV737_g4761, partial [Chaetothyriales sp. CBS 132003]